MSVTGKQFDRNAGVRRVILSTYPELHPFSNSQNAAQNYFCLANDMKGFQIEVDLQAMPPGVTINQLAPNQVWWVEKRTTLYRLYLYGGIYDPVTRQINSTDSLPGSGTITLTSGSAVVTSSLVNSNSVIILTAQDNNTTGSLRVSSRIPGQSFTIQSTRNVDSGVVGYVVL